MIFNIYYWPQKKITHELSTITDRFTGINFSSNKKPHLFFFYSASRTHPGRSHPLLDKQIEIEEKKGERQQCVCVKKKKRTSNGGWVNGRGPDTGSKRDDLSRKMRVQEAASENSHQKSYSLAITEKSRATSSHISSSMKMDAFECCVGCLFVSFCCKTMRYCCCCCLLA